MRHCFVPKYAFFVVYYKDMPRRRRKQSSTSNNIMQLSAPNPTLLTFLGSSQPGSDAKRVTFNEMNAISNDEIVKRLDELEKKFESLASSSSTSTSAIDPLVNARITDLETEIKHIKSTGTASSTTTIDPSVNDRITDLDAKLAMELTILNNKITVTNDNLDNAIKGIQNAAKQQDIITNMLSDNINLFRDRIDKLSPPTTTTTIAAAAATTGGKYDSQIQHLIGGTWY